MRSGLGAPRPGPTHWGAGSRHEHERRDTGEVAAVASAERAWGVASTDALEILYIVLILC